MNIISEIMSRNERDKLETDVINVIDKYFLSHNIPLRAFYPNSKYRKEFYKGKTNWLCIRLEPNNLIYKAGYRLYRTLNESREKEQIVLDDEKVHKEILAVLNEYFRQWYFTRIKRDNVEFAFLIDVCKRK